MKLNFKLLEHKLSNLNKLVVLTDTNSNFNLDNSQNNKNILYNKKYRSNDQIINKVHNPYYKNNGNQNYFKNLIKSDLCLYNNLFNKNFNENLITENNNTPRTNSENGYNLGQIISDLNSSRNNKDKNIMDEKNFKINQENKITQENQSNQANENKVNIKINDDNLSELANNIMISIENCNSNQKNNPLNNENNINNINKEIYNDSCNDNSKNDNLKVVKNSNINEKSKKIMELSITKYSLFLGNNLQNNNKNNNLKNDEKNEKLYDNNELLNDDGDKNNNEVVQNMSIKLLDESQNSKENDHKINYFNNIRQLRNDSKELILQNVYNKDNTIQNEFLKCSEEITISPKRKNSDIIICSDKKQLTQDIKLLDEDSEGKEFSLRKDDNSKHVTFCEEDEYIYICYDEEEKPKRLKIYNGLYNQIKFIPKTLVNCINKLKNQNKPKSIFKKADQIITLNNIMKKSTNSKKLSKSSEKSIKTKKKIKNPNNDKLTKIKKRNNNYIKETKNKNQINKIKKELVKSDVKVQNSRKFGNSSRKFFTEKLSDKVTRSLNLNPEDHKYRPKTPSKSNKKNTQIELNNNKEIKILKFDNKFDIIQEQEGDEESKSEAKSSLIDKLL